MVTTIHVDRDEEAAKAKFLTERASLILERIPASYRATDPFDPRLDPRVISACAAWEYSPEVKGLGFCGETGLGKTRGIYWLMLRLMRQVTFEKNRYGLEATYLNCRAINDAEFCEMVKARSAFSKGGSDDARKKFDQLCRCDILFLDDLGQGEMSSTTCSGLYSLIERRNGEYRPIFFTTNFSGAALIRRFPNDARGKAVVRRLAECCNVTVLDDTTPITPLSPDLFAGSIAGKAT
jgi:DNA replication protein DnaC